MAYGKRIYGTFRQGDTNLQGEVEIWQNLYGGAATEMLLGGERMPYRLGGSGDKYAIVKGSEITIAIAVQEGDNFSFLYTNDDREFMVIVKLNSLVKFTGFVLVNQYQEDFEYGGLINIVASDQLGLLDTKPYSFGSPAVSPTGYASILAILANILSKTTTSKTGLNLNINVACNLFESTMNMTDADDPLYQASVNQDRWINEDLTAADCLTVLRDVLGPLQCRLLQSGGEWWVERVPELADVAIDYRKFSAAGVYVSDHTLAPQVEVDDDTALIVLPGGSLEYATGWRQRDLEVDYGLKPSLIPSFDLPDSAFVSDTVITGWTNAGAIWSRIHGTSGNVMAAYTNSRESLDTSLYINADPIDVTMDHELHLTIKTGRIENVLLPLYCKIRIFIVDETETFTNYYFDDIEDWGGENDIKGVNFPKVKSIEELVEQSITIKNIPFNGRLWIRIYAPYRADLASTNGWFYFRDIKLTGSLASEAGDDHIKSQVFSDFLTDDTNFIPDAEKIRFSDGLGDDSLIQFYNGFIKVGLFGSRLWVKKALAGSVDPIPLVASTSAWGHIADSWWWQYSSSNKRFRGALLGTLWFHNTIKFNEISNTIFLLDDVTIDLYDNTVDGVFEEIKAETSGSGSGDLTLKSRGLASDSQFSGGGLVPQPGGNDNELQVKSGGDFVGTSGVTYDPTTGRLIKGGTLPLCEYRRGVVSVASGEQPIEFDEPFLTGDEYAFSQAALTGVTASDDVWHAVPYDLTISGFKINFPEAVTFNYDAMIKR